MTQIIELTYFIASVNIVIFSHNDKNNFCAISLFIKVTITFYIFLKLFVQLQLQLNQDLSILHQDDGSSKNKRGVLPKHATNVMRSWLFQHIGVRTKHDQQT